MKRIHFDNMKNKIWIGIMILALALILIGGFKVFEFENPIINKALSTLGFFLQVIYFSRIFWYKNVVQWNKKGVYIRINSFSGKSLRFNQIQNTVMDQKKLTLTKTSGKKLSFNLNNIEDVDAHKLNEILITNTHYNKL